MPGNAIVEDAMSETLGKGALADHTSLKFNAMVRQVHRIKSNLKKQITDGPQKPKEEVNLFHKFNVLPPSKNK